MSKLLRKIPNKKSSGEFSLSCEHNPWRTLSAQQRLIDQPAGYYLAPLEDFLSYCQRPAFNPATTGLWLPSDTDPRQLQQASELAQIIAIDFPALTDGRGFSLAHMLRDALEYQGELRAVGKYMQDQVFYLSRCGFDTFEVSDEVDTHAYNTSLHDFSDSYQAAIDEPQPLFRRRD